MIFIPRNSWQIKKVGKKGNGIFAKKRIAKGTIIGDYIGTVLKTIDVDLAKEQKNLYMMYFSDQAVIYPDLKKAGIHLLNHSCKPNCWIYTTKGHTLVFAIQQIEPKEELTIDYLLAPKTELCNPCTHKCECMSENCRGSFHLDNKKFKKWRKLEDSIIKKDKRQKVEYGKTLPLLSRYPKQIPKKYIKTVLLDLV